MTTAARMRHIARTRTALREMLAGLAAAERQWAQLEGGMRAQAFGPQSSGTVIIDEDGQGRSTISDPTGNAAAEPSAARQAQAELDELLQQLLERMGA